MSKTNAKPQPVTVRFESFGEFVEQAKKESNGNAGRASRERGDRTFYQTHSFDEAVKLSETGWAEGAAEVLRKRASLDSYVEQVVASHSTQVSYDYTGDYVDVGRFLSGEPECFGTVYEGESSRGPIVRLVANGAVSCGVSTESIFARGAAILAAVDIIEATGRRVELTLAFGAEESWGDPKPNLEVFVPIKSAHQQVDADRLAFALCHASSFRRLGFSIWEQQGYNPACNRPAPVTAEDGTVKTPEACRPGDFRPSELRKHVAEICKLVGIEIPELCHSGT